MTHELAREWIKEICAAQAWPGLFTRDAIKDPTSKVKVHKTESGGRAPRVEITGYELATRDHNGYFKSGYYLGENGELYHVTTYQNDGPVCIVQFYEGPSDPPWSDETVAAILWPLQELEASFY